MKKLFLAVILSIFLFPSNSVAQNEQPVKSSVPIVCNKYSIIHGNMTRMGFELKWQALSNILGEAQFNDRGAVWLRYEKKDQTDGEWYLIFRSQQYPEMACFIATGSQNFLMDDAMKVPGEDS